MSNSNKKLGKAKIYSFIPTGEYYFKRGIKAYDRFDLKRAKKYLQRAMELEPFEPIIACQLAIIYTETGEYEKSNQLLFKILNEIDSNMTECHYFLANNFAHLGLFTEAYKHAQTYLELDFTGEFAEEAKELLELISIEENIDFEDLAEQDEMIENLEEARNLLETGQIEEAIILLEKTSQAFPELWPAKNNLALAYFYKGLVDKAFQILQDVLDKNPGNLHALCNLAVFLYYEQQYEELEELLTALDKVQPIHFEHRYKLGVTYAFVGRYDQAFPILRQLQKYGYDGDSAFYYWLAKSAHFTGNVKVALDAWAHLTRENPEYAKIEPWMIEIEPPFSLENQNQWVRQLLQSEQIENRLCGIFYSSLTDLQNGDPATVLREGMTPLEKRYIYYLTHPEKIDDIFTHHQVKLGHEVALILHENYEANMEEGHEILLFWFKLFSKITDVEKLAKNLEGTAAAAEYLALRETSRKKTQNDIAEEYDLSVSTVRKYIRLLESQV